MPIQLICAERTCGAPFLKTHSRMAYCSARCRNRHKMRGWRARHPDKQTMIEKRRWLKHRDKRSEKNRLWRLENRESQNAKSRAYHQVNREKANSRRRERRATHHEEEKLRQRQYGQRARVALPWKPLLKSAYERSIKKKVPFALTPEWAEERWTGHCEITGIPFGIGLRESGPKTFSPSIDRIVPALGYVPTNCRFVIWAVNAFKYDGTDEDMISIARAIIEYADKRPITVSTISPVISCS